MTGKIHAGVDKIEIIGMEEPQRFHFLELHRLKLRNHYPDGSQSQEYSYELSLRRHLDAVAALLFEKKQKFIIVHLRKTLRPGLIVRQTPPALLRPGLQVDGREAVLLEVVAGLVEQGEASQKGFEQRALAEIWEEAGYRVQKSALFSLGESILPTPGMNPERIHLFAACIDGLTAEIPPGDGSPVEEIGGMQAMDIETALAQCLQGQIADGKTEICLHRLQALAAQGKI